MISLIKSTLIVLLFTPIFTSMVVTAQSSKTLPRDTPPATLDLPQGPFVKQGILQKLGDHTYAIPDEDVSGVPNVGIIVGETATLVIDPGLGEDNGKIVLAEVAKVSNNKQLYIVSTHFHPEHTTGYIAFPESAIYINAKAQEEEFVQSSPAVWSYFENLGPVFKGLLKGVERRVADITFDTEHTLDLGGVTVRMVMVGPAHTKADTVFFVEEDNVLFSGDVVMKNSFLAAMDDTDARNWLSTFDVLEALPTEIIVPAHGEFGDHKTIAENREWFEQAVQHALEFKSEHIPESAAIRMITEELLAQHPSWGRSFGIAGIVRDVYREE